jgi:Mn-dependent DtxR family transcriptional regulator
LADRDFKGVWIPKAIWLDERLTALDKVILTEIDSLDQGERGCYASNKHIADFCQCSEAKVTKSISHLTKLGYLYVQ